MAVYNKTYWPVDPLTGQRPVGYTRSGVTGDHITPNAYDGFGCTLEPFRVFVPDFYPSGGYLSTDGPNTDPIHFLAYQNFGVAAMNAAWSSLIDKVRSGPASLGESLAEGREAMGMIAERLIGLTRGFRRLRKGDFRGFLRSFGIGPKRKHQSKIRNSLSEVSGLWLEYSFGWSPLCQDIYDAATTLQKPVPSFSFVGRGSEDWSYAAGTRKHRGKIHCKQGADFYVSNPSLYLLQNLGVANPIQVAWNLVPFSFFVDWVSGVSSWLGGLTDLLGLTVIRPYSTRFIRTDGEIEWDYSYLGWGTYSQRIHCWIVRRHPFLTKPLPNTHFLRNLGTSWKRAANAASVLVSLLNGHSITSHLTAPVTF